MAGRTNKLVDGKFSTQINPKNGHAIAACVDPREKRVLEFVILILCLEKSSRVMLTVGNTIFGALSEVRKVNWGLIIQEVVEKLVSALEKGKPSPISPYLFHLYHRFECLREEKIVKVEAAKYYMEYGVSPEAETQSDVVEVDLDRELLSFTKQRKMAASPGSRRKSSSYKGNTSSWSVLPGGLLSPWAIVSLETFVRN